MNKYKSARTQKTVLFVLVSLGGLACAYGNRSQSSVDPASKTNPAVISLPTPSVSPYTVGEWSEHFDKALTLSSTDKEAAIMEMQKALVIKPDDKVALNWIAVWYSTLGRPEDQAVTYRRWIGIDPKDGIAHSRLASLLIRELKQYEEGLIEAQITQSLSSGQLAYVDEKLIAEAYEGLKDYPNAIAHYKLYLKGSKTAHNPDPHADMVEKIVELKSKEKPH